MNDPTKTPPKKIPLNEVIQAAYVYAYLHDKDVMVWVPLEDYVVRRWTGICSDFQFLFYGESSPDAKRHWQAPLKWRVHSRVTLEKAKKFMKRHEDRAK